MTLLGPCPCASCGAIVTVERTTLVAPIACGKKRPHYHEVREPMVYLRDQTGARHRCARVAVA